MTFFTTKDRVSLTFETFHCKLRHAVLYNLSTEKNMAPYLTVFFPFRLPIHFENNLPALFIYEKKELDRENLISLLAEHREKYLFVFTEKKDDFGKFKNPRVKINPEQVMVSGFKPVILLKTTLEVSELTDGILTVSQKMIPGKKEKIYGMKDKLFHKISLWSINSNPTELKNILISFFGFLLLPEEKFFSDQWR